MQAESVFLVLNEAGCTKASTCTDEELSGTSSDRISENVQARPGSANISAGCGNAKPGHNTTYGFMGI